MRTFETEHTFEVSLHESRCSYIPQKKFENTICLQTFIHYYKLLILVAIVSLALVELEEGKTFHLDSDVIIMNLFSCSSRNRFV